MKDCAFDRGCECNALTEKKCKGCAFCKTTEELIEGRQKAEERIRTLPQTTQTHIKRKYYSRESLEEYGTIGKSLL